MDKKKRIKLLPSFVVVTLLLVFFTSFQGSSADGNQLLNKKKRPDSKFGSGFGSSMFFPVTGNVYPKGSYHVTLDIGHPPEPYFLDIDSGSDLTWLQCDAPCIKCTPAPHNLYRPKKDLVTCDEPLCAFVRWPADKLCKNPYEQCDYEIEYADRGSSMGVLVKDSISLRAPNGTIVGPHVVFGCGYYQEVPDSVHAPYMDGVLGLADGKSSIVSQLRELGLIGNILGHCLSGNGGFLFFGDEFVPSSGVVWMPMLRNSLENHYVLGSAELLHGQQTIGAKDLQVVFDSGSTYTYFNSDVYQAMLSMIEKDLNEQQLEYAAEDQNLPVCWKGAKPFRSIHDVKNYFKPLVLSFSKAKNIKLQLPPEAYLIVTEHGNVCLGVLNGTEVGLGNFNIIGDIPLQDKMVIYDNERQQIGWVAANCNRLPNADRDYIEEGFSQPPGSSDTGILEQLRRRFIRWADAKRANSRRQK